MTDRIGLIATASTTYNEPYNLARAVRLAGPHQRRPGRLERRDHGRRGRGAELLPGGPARALPTATSGPPSSSTSPRSSGTAGRTTPRSGTRRPGSGRTAHRVHPIDHAGRYFRVQGPLDVPRPPQGHPLIVQAGSSEDGKDFAARYAEAVFTAQQTLAEAQRVLRRPEAEDGRRGPRPGPRSRSCPALCRSSAPPRPRRGGWRSELDELIHPEHARKQLAGVLRVSPESLPLDAQLPEDLPSEDEIEGAKSRYTLIVELARRERLTVRQLIGRLGGGRGHRTFSGTPEQVADAIQEWFEQGAADGFNIMPPVLPVGPGRLRGPRHADPAGPRAVPPAVHGEHAARALRAGPARQRVRRCGLR